MKLNGRMIDCPEGAQRGLSSDGSADRMTKLSTSYQTAPLIGWSRDDSCQHMIAVYTLELKKCIEAFVL